MRWQMSLYKEMAGKAEDAEDPEKVVKRVQEVSSVLYHIEVVSSSLKLSCSACKHDHDFLRVKNNINIVVKMIDGWLDGWNE